jgi:hypothetical protein
VMCLIGVVEEELDVQIDIEPRGMHRQMPARHVGRGGGSTGP